MIRSTLLLICISLLLCSFGSADNIPWLDNYSNALAAAKQTSRPIFIDCFAEWCVWCHRLDEEVYTDPQFVKFLQGFVPLRINVEDHAGGTKLATHFAVDSLPSLLITDSNGKLLNRIGSFLKSRELISEINEVQDLLQKEKLNPLDWATVQALAEEYLFRDMNYEAEIRFQRILEASGVSDSQKESAYFSLALAHYYQGKKSEALITLNRYLDTYTEGNSAEDVLLLLSQIYIEMDEKDKARAALQQFIAKFPDSDNAVRAKRVLALIEP